MFLFYFFHHHVFPLCPLPPFPHPTQQANAEGEGGLLLTVSHDHALRGAQDSSLWAAVRACQEEELSSH